jgi:type IV pilus assembly protein PilC
MKQDKKFIWQGIDANGFKITGEIEADHIQAAKIKITSQKITLLKITRKFELGLWSSKNKIKDIDITEWSVEFYTLISSGVPLANALGIMADSARKSSMKNMTNAIKKQVESGCFLSESIRSHERYFGALFCNLIHAGEHAGMLDMVLKNLASYREKIAALKKKIKKALFYPCAVLVVALGVTCAMLIFVLPQFEQLFQGVGAELPLLTKIVIQTGDELRQHSGTIFMILTAAFFLVKSGVKRFKSWRDFFDRFWIKLPLIGNVLLEAIFARCFRTLSTTLRAGLPLVDALQLTANVTGNSFYTEAFKHICQQVKNGQTLNLCFKNTKLFPQRVIQMIAIGEESGRLDDMLQKLSNYFEEQVDYKVDGLSQLLEPALMVFLCVIVGTLVIAMYLPIFRLGSVL